MDSYSIGIGGLDAAKKGLDIIGNNVANAATEGYHRQRINLTPSKLTEVGDLLIGGGVDFAGTTRLINNFLEQEFRRQQSSLGENSQILSTMQTLETSLGELSSGEGLSWAINSFFNSLEELSQHPDDSIWQNNAIGAGRTMAGQFRSLAASISDLEHQIMLEAEGLVDEINTITTKIAELNEQIKTTQMNEGKLNNTLDQRDKLVEDLAELSGVELIQREYGVVDISIAGIPVVTGVHKTDLETAMIDDGYLGVGVKNENNFSTSLDGGRLAGLIKLKNEYIHQAHADLDRLAQSIAGQINKLHVQSVGSDGSFAELNGSAQLNEQLALIEPPVRDGNIYFRVTNTATGEVARQSIAIDASADTLSDVASAITSDIDHVIAEVRSGQLQIDSAVGYEFDFLPAVLSEPTVSNLTGASPPDISVSGIYEGTENQTFSFEITGSDGQVSNGNLALTVRDGSGDVVNELDIGAGYAAGEQLEIGNGLKIALSPGDLNVGDTFEVDAFNKTDTSNLLAAVGINTFFTGNSAAELHVDSDIINSPGRVATAMGANMTDNTNALAMAEVKDEPVDELGGYSPREFYNKLVADTGQDISLAKMRRDNVEGVIRNLSNQIEDASGVDINDEAAKMLVFEQMFQAMSRYLNTVNSSMRTLMDLI